ncbi:MAG: hypothetical protein ACREDQ_01750 [Limisphaerales bacterium]
MKISIAFIACILVGIGIGWHFGRAHAITEHQRALEAQIVAIDRQRAESYKTAKPWVEGTAEIALAGLKHLDSNDTAEAKYRFAELIALYYRGHPNDGDTNWLLADIEAFAAKDVVLSNEIYGK